MDILYLVASSKSKNGQIEVPLETVISLFVIKNCKPTNLDIKFLRIDEDVLFTIKNDSQIGIENNLESDVLLQLCNPPFLVLENQNVVSGLCSVLRHVVKKSENHESLLGFRGGCLMACAESSIWTRFCEVDILETVKTVASTELIKNNLDIPINVCKFEVHMSCPVRIHNIGKKKHEILKSKLGPVSDKLEIEDCVLEHVYAEGISMTLSDIILYPCFRIILNKIHSSNLKLILPLTYKWLDEMAANLPEANLDFLINNSVVEELNIDYYQPSVEITSLYKSDTKDHRFGDRIYTKQKDIDLSLQKTRTLPLIIDQKPFGYETNFDWTSLPSVVCAEGNGVPIQRQKRKSFQLENIIKAVLKIAKPGHIIVDFCSGAGHIGILLAYLLPLCKIILLENKEQSLLRAAIKVDNLQMTNIILCRSNLFYFKGRFDIGVALHACGVATDLVMEKCVKQSAAFVLCPCCYGAIQNTHSISYPRSTAFLNLSLSPKDYFVISHASDQTHGLENVKTNQGNYCMMIVDTDRCLYAKENGYEVNLAKMIPETCSPKNNLLVGTPDNFET